MSTQKRRTFLEDFEVEPRGEPLTGLLGLTAGIMEGQSESFLVSRHFGRRVSTEGGSRTPEEFGSLTVI